MVLRAPPAHRRVGEMARLVPVATQALPALVLRDTLFWFVRPPQSKRLMPHAESLLLPANQMLYSTIPSPAPNGNL